MFAAFLAPFGDSVILQEGFWRHGGLLFYWQQHLRRNSGVSGAYNMSKLHFDVSLVLIVVRKLGT